MYTKVLCSVLLLLFAVSCSSGSYRTFTRQSAGIAPDPQSHTEAIIHVYGADTWGWRGWFAIHTWIATKRTNEDRYTVYDVVGWRGRWGSPVLGIQQDIPDRYWYGAKPELLQEIRGEGVDQLIDAIDTAARTYPWQSTYKAFPGPNSNTFVAWIGKQVPELELNLPFSAIGSWYVYWN